MASVVGNYIPSIWFGVGLPGRPALGTYGNWTYESLPKLSSVNNPFFDIKTLAQLRQHAARLPKNSPTACYFSLDSGEDDFYHDQQDCVVWHLDKDGCVYVDSEDSRLVVATSLSEFLWRIAIENDLWFDANDYEIGEKSEECERYGSYYTDLMDRTRAELLPLFPNLDSWIQRVTNLLTNVQPSTMSNEYLQCLDHLAPELQFQYFGGLTDESHLRVEALIRACDVACCRGVLCWSLIATRRWRMDKNVAKIVSMMLWATRAMDWKNVV